MTTENDISGEKRKYTPSEEIAVKSFDLISLKDFNTLGEILSDDVVFKDPHFPDVLEGKGNVLTGLGIGFKDVDSIRFNIRVVGNEANTPPTASDMNLNKKSIFVLTDTYTSLRGGPINLKIGQVFYFETIVTNATEPIISRIEAYPDYPPPSD
ncbi:hypothetical protein A3A76_04265 [Candidatus Woesebacteria bacterium RIFCSPLOWO2_01_FULL_39_23]|uniref:Uncharacterized protein n=1 Tax=Candidatus Woesebacteria bacterium RIFCSPHIGHO2_01_FULL_40_22 TaxID=1802499 RepID=A0A1F7YF54_9BACT|nr:MAG: hypothetical protein A2141_01830 [Candidatus Woesebacteria bacterium RBG_16_40_11]OGM25967.1 MAG: hypothetical protein A2628_00265 [Candidatus Woesebacteria bacterium RIFCSPHIGHO2_01_FULL_40_22]OGM38079.1 MAG: hypothetical protein A3E41_03350 [Candidatus Woesebacteria bacterium RIFCSPHIGHO2_12_FULL_38_9]OGM61816.1 MAG: hypothetical protein A3A76_04265 [Candidatus Woesebacteria bacterium RIFCSPLOWO2_01_FULL_39_23]